MFLRGVGNLAPNEQMVYNYWFVTLSLLETGIPWDTNRFTQRKKPE